MSDVLIVVDMQRAFLEEGNPLYCGDGTHTASLNTQTSCHKPNYQ